MHLLRRQLRRLIPGRRGCSRAFLLLFCMAMVCGCPQASRRHDKVSGKPALDLKKAVSFALAGEALPASSGDLIAALLGGMRGHVKLAPGAAPVWIETSNYPRLDRLIIDLSGAAIDTGQKPAKLDARDPVRPGVRARSFEFRAAPLKVDGGHMTLDVKAQQVLLGVQHDRAGRPVLVLDDARDGAVFCQTTTRDLGIIFRASANQRGRPFGLSVQKARLRLTSANQRDLRADLKLASRLVLVPIQLHFTAHVHLDGEGDATLDHLTCDGDDLAGALITQFIRPALADYNHKTMPLVAFPSPRIRLHDVGIDVENETVRVTAKFGS